MAIARRQTLIEWLAQEVGWQLVGRQGDFYTVTANDHRSRTLIDIRHGDNVRSVLFQAWPSLRFPLAKPPHGLFGRLLLRSFDLTYAGWRMNISESCEASPTLTARIPVEALSPSLFRVVCDELINEILAFHQELRDRFEYDLGSATPAAPVGRAIVPRSSTDQGIVWSGD